MKIAVVIPKYGSVGGAEGFAYEVTERMAKHEGLKLHVFANQWQSGKTSITFHKVPIIQLSIEHQDYKWVRMQDIDKMPLVEGALEALQKYKKN